MRRIALLLLLLAPALAGCISEPGGASGYAATVRWTDFGIPHVTAQDWGSLGYGYGVAFARDGLCVFAEEVVTVRGERSLHWPPQATYRTGGNGGVQTNEASDAFWHFVQDSPDLYPPAELRPEVRALFDGFAAGYDRYLADTGVQHLPEACRGQAWVRPITAHDLLLREMKLRLLASSGFFLQGIYDAQPPLAGRPAAAHAGALPTPERLGIGSNAYAYGKDATGGPGLLLGNPHFPWQGPERFHEVHLTIPGQLDVMGAAITGMPLVVIGFQDAVAWSHTVSTAWRFTLHELSLLPGDPTSILVDGQVEHLQPRVARYEVRTAQGVEERTHTFWLSRWGPLVSLHRLLGMPGEQEGVPLDLTWSPAQAFALHDANAPNTRLAEQWFRMDTARSFDEFQASLDDVLGIPWVNTIAVSPDGRALYADHGVVPDLDAAKIADCNTPLGQATFDQFRLPVLDGSRSACDWTREPGQRQEGTLPPDKLPIVERADYVLNSNDSHWLPHPRAPLEGFSPMVGAERAERSGRTRMGYVESEERLGGAADCAIDPQVPCARMTLPRVEALLLDNRVYWGESERDGLVAGACALPVALGSGGQPVDLTQACAVLRAWDLRANATSKGLALFEQTWLKVQPVWRTPFDPARPVDTPSGLAPDPRLAGWLADAVLDLQAAGVPLDAAGDARFIVRQGEHVPVQGASGAIGAPDAMAYALGPHGFGEPLHGSSYVQAVTFDARGPVADAVLTYGQSQDLDSPHSGDQARLWAAKGWVRLPFHEADVAAGSLERVEVRG